METQLPEPALSLVEECSRAFRYPSELKQHLRTTSVPHPFCAICGQHFPGQVSYESHRAAKHPQAPPSVFTCGSCPRKVFTTQGALGDHYRDSPRHPKCQNCVLGFKDQAAYADHVRVAHPVRRCPVCTVVLFDDEALEDHFFVSANHPSCPYCHIGFKDQFEADNHAIAFHPEIRCKLCQCKFESSHALHKHYRSSSKHRQCLDCACGYRKSNDSYNEGPSLPKSVISPKVSPPINNQRRSSLDSYVPALEAQRTGGPSPAYLDARSSPDAPLVEEETVKDEDTATSPPSRPPSDRLAFNDITPDPSTSASDRATFSHSTPDIATSNRTSPDHAVEDEEDAELAEAQRMLTLEQNGNRLFPLRLRPSGPGDEFVHHISASASPLSPIPSRPWTDARRLLELAASQTNYPDHEREASRSEYSSFTTSPRPGTFQSLQALVQLELSGVGRIQQEAGNSGRTDEFEVDLGDAVHTEETVVEVVPEIGPSQSRFSPSHVHSTHSTPSPFDPDGLDNFSKGWRTWQQDFSHSPQGQSSQSDEGPRTPVGLANAAIHSVRSDSTSPRSPGFFSRSSPFLASSPSISPPRGLAPLPEAPAPDSPLSPDTDLHAEAKVASEQLASLLQLSEDFTDCLSPFVADFSAQQIFSTALSSPRFQRSAASMRGDPVLGSSVFFVEEPLESPHSNSAQHGTTDGAPSSSRSSRLPSTSGSWSDVGELDYPTTKTHGLDIVVHQPTPSHEERRLEAEPPLQKPSAEETLAPQNTPPHLHCRICKRDSCEDVTATMCGHIFCYKCITDAVIAAPRCPVCSTPTLLYCLFRLDLSA